jgi:hypothetical protein
MAADLGELGSTLLPVRHPRLHPTLPSAAVSCPVWPDRVCLFVNEHVLDQAHRQAECDAE